MHNFVALARRENLKRFGLAHRLADLRWIEGVGGSGGGAKAVQTLLVDGARTTFLLSANPSGDFTYNILVYYNGELQGQGFSISFSPTAQTYTLVFDTAPLVTDVVTVVIS